jgi:SAM-dependent methyltransferase
VPDPSISDHYVGDRGTTYARWQLAMSAGMGPITARFFRRFVRMSDTVLDFGCGGGEMLLALACARRLGVEPNQASRDVATGRLIEVSASLASVPDHTVDVVVTSHALEHCTRPLDELRNINRVLKPEGRLVLLIPLDDWRTQRRFNPSDINHHLYGWTPQLLGNLLADADLVVERMRVVTHAWPPGSRLWSQLPQWAFDALCIPWSILRRRRQIHAVCHPRRMSP